MAKSIPQLTDTKLKKAKFNPNGKGNKLFDGGGQACFDLGNISLMLNPARGHQLHNLDS